jgi:hypothetical protein
MSDDPLHAEDEELWQEKMREKRDGLDTRKHA